MNLTLADGIFSKYIRLRDSVDGRVHCFICGKGMSIDEATAGHFIKRRHLATRYDERNVHALCSYCNGMEECQPTVSDLHHQRMREKYGQQVLDELYFRSRQPFKLTKADLKEIVKTYKTKIKKHGH